MSEHASAARNEVPGGEPRNTGTPAPKPASEKMPEPSSAPAPAPAQHPASASTQASSNGSALSLRGLRKSFNNTPVVKDVSLEIPRGSFYGIVGPNGAGKTTTLSMATGLLRPDAGTAVVMGVDMWEDPSRAKKEFGVLADGLRTFDRLTGPELLSYHGLIRGMDKNVVAERSRTLLDALGLTGDEGKLVVDYSAGMTKKILLACALLHSPKLLVLDEPLEAVDPVSGEHIRGILRAYVRQGGTVVLSSHVMQLVEELCSHVAVIADGSILAHGTLDEVRQGGSLVQRFVDLVGAEDLDEGSLAWLGS